MTRSSDFNVSGMTLEELLALPENGGTDVMIDPHTGLAEPVRRPARFLVRVGDVLSYELADGSRWRVGRDMDGTLYRERLPL